MRKVALVITFLTLIGCQNLVDDQSGINGKIEDFVRDNLYPHDTIQSVDFSRFLRGEDKKPTYYWLDYTFRIRSNGQQKLLEYHFETDSLLNIKRYKDISAELHK